MTTRTALSGRTGTGCIASLRRTRKRMWFATRAAYDATETPWHRVKILLSLHVDLQRKAESAFRHAKAQGKTVDLVTLGSCESFNQFRIKLEDVVIGRASTVCDRLCAIEFELDFQNHILKKERTGF